MTEEISNLDVEKAKQKVSKLVENYELASKSGRLKSYTEEETKKNFILPLFQALGWDVYDEKGIHEVSAEEHISHGKADYGFRINGIPKFFVEAKSFKAGVDRDDFAFQAINYAYHKGVTWAILTNFEKIKVYNGTWKERLAALSKFFTIEARNFVKDFDQLMLLSKDAMSKNLLDMQAERYGKKIRKVPITQQLFSDLTKFRELLTKDIIKRNENLKLSDDELDESVQRILDRLIFIRTVEDRQFDPPQLRSLNRDDHKGKKWKKLTELFRQFDENYDSNLFRQHISEELIIDDDVLEDIIRRLHETEDKTVLYDFSAIDADILGGVYEQYLGHILKKTKKTARLKNGSTKRKEEGIYYTPVHIVDYIVKNTVGEVLKKKVGIKKDVKILDPACGSGSFLIKTLDYLTASIPNFEEYEKSRLETYGKENIASEKFNQIKDSIFGVDKDTKAVEISQLNLLLKAAVRKGRLPTLQENIKCGNSLIDDPKIVGDKAFKWEKEFSDIFQRGKFNVVIGNPPYFNIKSNDELKNSPDFKTLSAGVVNSASLFLKKGLDLLKNDGYLGFIIPKSFLIVDSWEPIRSIILENTLVSACDVSMAFEQVGLEQVIIIVKKAKPKDNHVKILTNFEEINKIPQEFFKQRGLILTSLDKERLPLVEKIEKKTIKLSEIAEMPRGITVLSSEYSDTQLKDMIQVLGGTNVERYRKKEGAKRKPNRFLPKHDKRIQNKISIFDQERIIYQNIASSVPKIVATLESEKLPTDDTLNNLILNNSEFSYKYILAILNSKLITFYLRYAIINNSILTIHLDKPYLGRIPIRKSSNMKKIEQLVDEINSLDSKIKEFGKKLTDKRLMLEDQIKKTDKQIDEEIFQIYEISESEQELIEKSLN